MSFIDKFYQMKTVYEINRKSHKWCHHIFLFSGRCMCEHFCYQQMPTCRATSPKDFQSKIVSRLVSEHYVQASGSKTATSPRELAAGAKKCKPKIPLEVRQTGSNHQLERYMPKKCT